MNAMQHRSLIVSVAVHVGFVAFARFAKPGAALRDSNKITQMEFSLWTPAPWRQLARQVEQLSEPAAPLNERAAPTPPPRSSSKPPGASLLRAIERDPEATATTAVAPPEPTAAPPTSGALSRELIFGPGRETSDPYSVVAASRGQAVLTSTTTPCKD